MDFVLNQPGLCQGEGGKLYGGCKASRIGYVVSLAYFVLCTLAQSVYEIPAGIFAVQPEIVAEVNYPAVTAYVMVVNELP